MNNDTVIRTASTVAATTREKTRPYAEGTRDEDNWDQRLGFLMHDVSRLRRLVFDSFVEPLGVTRSQWWVIAHLSRHDGMMQSDLANVLELGKAALGGLVDRLEASGFIERRPDGSDRRVKRVYLTPAGNGLVNQMRAMSHEMNERILADLDHSRRQQLAELLQQVKRNLLVLKRESEGTASTSSADE
ncbi:MarR family transcriptional regulator [Trinickia symbiotica]|uniref:MarR family transcriptional regulator n=1 Tax=Trinickia symbiotica TaxID=863227 RepID=A0A2T3XZ41_9BURK|nr:MarR family transcriptional regulator [Trinickia symbiotica]PTB21768.1 MarR family transcriptional regulator [Trinickia symbiotica]